MEPYPTLLGKIAEALVLERNHEKETYAALLKKDNLKERKEEGFCLHPLKCTKSGFGLGDYPFLLLENRNVDNTQHKFDHGTPALVQVPGEPEKTLNATVMGIQGKEIKVSLHCEEIPDWIYEKDLSLEMVFDNRVFEEMMGALSNAINTDNKELKHRLQIIYEGKKVHEKEEMLSFQFPSLNASQNEAAVNALNTPDITVIHGPPGTGKTTTLVAVCQAILQNEKRILVCAPSNAATDYLTELLASRGLDVVRVGNLSRIDVNNADRIVESLIRKEKDFKLVDNFKRQALDHAKQAGKFVRNFGPAERAERASHRSEFKNLLKQARDIENYLVEKCLNRAQIITSTLTSVNHFHLRKMKFETVIVDEAGQTTDPAVLMAMLKGTKLILAGDPFQLPPTVKSPEAEKAGLSRTMLERLTGREDLSRMLTIQYRMHRDIMQFSNEKFYQSKLQAHQTVADRKLAEEDRALEMIDTAGCGMEESFAEKSASKYNEGEIRILQIRLEELTTIRPNASIGVISPYKEQVRLLRERLAKSENLTIDTIDAFQGRESDIILISLVRSNETSEIGFLKDYRRMNVALTRARMKLVVIGDSATLGNDDFYNSFFEHVENTGIYRSGWEFPV